MKPILFNTEMVRAIIDGRKTQTRRVIKLSDNTLEFTGHSLLDGQAIFCEKKKGVEWSYQKHEMQMPRYYPEDILYVRETWLAVGNVFKFPTHHIYKASPELCPKSCPYAFNGEWQTGCLSPRWRPSIHMPKEAARIFLKVTDVRVERLQDITEDNAKAEGVEPTTTPNIPGKGITHIQGFGELWNSTVKKSDLNKYGWNANPWVWVYEFERIEKP